MSARVSADVVPMATSGPPYFGGVLRVVWQHVRDRMLQAIHEAGFTDFQEAHFAVFSYPLPMAQRPSEMARQKRMSRQAVNYLAGQLEGLGYLERRASEAGNRRLIHLSPKGQELAETMFACLRQLHMECAEEVGQDRFEVFLAVLRELEIKAQRGGEGTS